MINKLIDKIKYMAETCHYLTKMPFGHGFLILGSIVCYESKNLIKLLLFLVLFIVAFVGTLGPQFQTMNIPGEIALFIIMLNAAFELIANYNQYPASSLVLLLITLCYFPIGIISFLYTIFYKEE